MVGTIAVKRAPMASPIYPIGTCNWRVGKKDASRTPPRRPKSYFRHTDPFPGKFQKDLEKLPLHSVAERRII